MWTRMYKKKYTCIFQKQTMGGRGIKNPLSIHDGKPHPGRRSCISCGKSNSNRAPHFRPKRPDWPILPISGHIWGGYGTPDAPGQALYVGSIMADPP